LPEATPQISSPGWDEEEEAHAVNQAVAELEKIAKELGGSVGQLAIAWCNRNPHVSTVILGASRLAQLKENLGAIALTPKLTPEVLARIHAITNPLAE
jgi:aryl-alcohol dehydrogenase-like predicted oxidoreductase